MPQVGESPRIGKDAEQAVHTKRPKQWLSIDLDGDNDYGLDVLYQLERDGTVVATFFAQIKGTLHPRLNAAEDHFAVSIKASTLNYLHQNALPKLLLLVDLSKCDDPRDANVYYSWIDDQIDFLCGKDEFLTSQDSYTLYIPVNQAVTPSLDIADEIEELGAQFRSQRKLYQSLRDNAPESKLSTDALQQITSNLDRFGSDLVDALVETPDRPWFQATPGQWANRLKDLAEQVRYGDYKGAESRLCQLDDDVSGMSSYEQAEYFSLRGIIEETKGHFSESTRLHRLANEAVPNSPHYTTRYVESQLHSMPSELSQDLVAPLIEQLDKCDGDPPRLLTAKLRGAIGDVDGALAQLANVQCAPTGPTRSVVWFLQKDWGRAETAATEALDLEDLPPRHRATCLTIRARSRFNQASIEFERGGREIVPYGGPLDLNLDYANDAWIDADDAMDALRKLGWPPDTRFIADIYAALSTLLGRTDVALGKLHEAATANTWSKSLQENLADVSIPANRPELGLRALDHFDDDLRLILKRVLMGYYARWHTYVVDLLEANWSQIPRDDRLFGSAVVCGALCARAIAHPFHSILEGELDANPDLQVDSAIYRYVCARDVSKSHDTGPREILYQALEEHPHDPALLTHLFGDLNPTRDDDAHECIAAGRRLGETRHLGFDEWNRLLTALVTVQDWSTLLTEVEHATRHFSTEKALTSFRALALDGLGRTSDALDTLSSIVSDPAVTADTVHLYIDICLRCGLYDDAKSLCRQLLARDLPNDSKLAILRQLALMCFADGSAGTEILHAVERYGELCNEDTESEEGAFLQLLMMVTCREDVRLTEEKKQLFKARLEAFVSKFPRSTVLRQVRYDSEASAETIIAQLEQAVGLTDEIKEERTNIKNKLRSGNLILPAAEKPNSLHEFHDLIHVWEMSKTTRDRDMIMAWHIRSNDSTSVAPEHILKFRPLVDLSALLVLNDLGIVDQMFTLFGRIAITKTSMWSLRQLASPIAGSFHVDKAVDLSDRLKDHLHQIDQIDTTSVELRESQLLKGDDVFSLRAAMSEGPYRLYSDDLVMRLAVTENLSVPDSMCTLDVLSAFDHQGILEKRALADLYASLLYWNVRGISLPFDICIASFPENILETTDGQSVRSSIDDDWACRACLEAAFDISIEYNKSIESLVKLIIYVSKQHEVHSGVVAGIVDKWLSNARFRKDFGADPNVHLAGALVYSAVLLSKEPHVHERLAKVRAGIMEAHEMALGSRMDDSHQIAMIRQLGEQTARVMSRPDVPESAHELPRLLRHSMSDESEREAYQEAYIASRARIERESESQQ